MERGQILLRKRSSRLPLRAWKGYCAVSSRKTGFRNVDEYVDEVRGKL